jgi:hypothetical protein
LNNTAAFLLLEDDVFNLGSLAGGWDEAVLNGPWITASIDFGSIGFFPSWRCLKRSQRK